MDKVSVFESLDFGELRIIVDPKGDVWFVASDVAKSLGYINAKDAVKRHVDDDDSMLLQVSDNQWGVKRSILKTRYIDSIRIINESGLYSLILSSKLESAKRFKKWVTDLRCVEVADVAEVVLIEEQTQRIQLIRNM